MTCRSRSAGASRSASRRVGTSMRPRAARHTPRAPDCSRGRRLARARPWVRTARCRFALGKLLHSGRLRVRIRRQHAPTLRTSGPSSRFGACALAAARKLRPLPVVALAENCPFPKSERDAHLSEGRSPLPIGRRRLGAQTRRARVRPSRGAPQHEGRRNRPTRTEAEAARGTLAS
jgi:hypothetical protein